MLSRFPTSHSPAASDCPNARYAATTATPSRGESPIRTRKDAAAFEEIILRDFVNFSGGVVPNLGTVTFDYVITDNTQHDLVFLRERPDFAPPEVVPEPATLLLFGSSLAGMAGALWRRHRKQDTSAA